MGCKSDLGVETGVVGEGLEAPRGDCVANLVEEHPGRMPTIGTVEVEVHRHGLVNRCPIGPLHGPSLPVLWSHDFANFFRSIRLNYRRHPETDRGGEPHRRARMGAAVGRQFVQADHVLSRRHAF